MSDLIDRQLAIDTIEDYADRLQMLDWKENPPARDKSYALNWCVNTIRDLPSAQPERNKGKLLPHKGKFWKKLWKCSECGAVTENASTAHYCYNCGAKMEEGDGRFD